MATPGKFQPDIYPVMYWGIAYGAIAGLALFILFLLSRFITLVWFPVFLAGLIWGGYRNYQKQKAAWYTNAGTAAPSQSPLNEFREAVSDVIDASQQIATNETQPAQKESPPTPPVPPAIPPG